MKYFPLTHFFFRCVVVVVVVALIIVFIHSCIHSPVLSRAILYSNFRFGRLCARVLLATTIFGHLFMIKFICFCYFLCVFFPPFFAFRFYSIRSVCSAFDDSNATSGRCARAPSAFVSDGHWENKFDDGRNGRKRKRYQFARNEIPRKLIKVKERKKKRKDERTRSGKKEKIKLLVIIFYLDVFCFSLLVEGFRWFASARFLPFVWVAGCR